MEGAGHKCYHDIHPSRQTLNTAIKGMHSSHIFFLILRDNYSSDFQLVLPQYAFGSFLTQQKRRQQRKHPRCPREKARVHDPRILNPNDPELRVNTDPMTHVLVAWCPASGP